MDADQLGATTADFYSVYAKEFDQSRLKPWDSWQGIAELLKNVESILDVGCGNGRFYASLDNPKIKYVGIDQSQELIAIATQRYPEAVFKVIDVNEGFADLGTYDALVCFGVMHHIAKHEQRIQLIKNMAKATERFLVVSFWRPKLLPNFDKKVITDLGNNDYLMGWQGDDAHPRFVHHFEENEIELLTKESGLDVVEQFDGGENDSSNRYVILRK